MKCMGRAAVTAYIGDGPGTSDCILNCQSCAGGDIGACVQCVACVGSQSFDWDIFGEFSAMCRRLFL